MASGFGAIAKGIGNVGSGIVKGASAANKAIPGGFKGGLKRIATGDRDAGKPPVRTPMDERFPGDGKYPPISPTATGTGAAAPVAPGVPSVIDRVKQRLEKGQARMGEDKKKSLTPPPNQQAGQAPSVGEYTPNWRINPRQ